MAFNINSFQRWSDGVAVLGNNMWQYTSSTDTLATIQAANYFDPLVIFGNGVFDTNTPLRINDIIWLQGSDAQGFATITALNPHVTVNPFSVVLGAGSVGTANIAAGAITTALLANLAVTGAKMANNTVTPTQLALNTIQYVQVPMTAAQWNAMSVTPVQIVAAPGAGLIIQATEVWYDMAFVSAAYANGGVVNLQYDNTATGAGVPVTTDTSAATINGLVASSIVRPGMSQVAMAQLTTVNKGLFMSNKTAPFITGDSTWKINVAYRVITA